MQSMYPGMQALAPPALSAPDDRGRVREKGTRGLGAAVAERPLFDLKTAKQFMQTMLHASTIKDLIDVAGQPATSGSRALEGRIPLLGGVLNRAEERAARRFGYGRS